MTPAFRRPASLSAAQADAIPGGHDPAARSEVAHLSAATLLHRGRAHADDPAIVDRLVRLVDREGIDVVAGLWADAPADTLPGALWRLYLLREWTRRSPQLLADRYRLGVEQDPVDGAIAGAADLPGPAEIRAVADAVLSGVFDGDFAVALERAGAFCRVLATGAALDADGVERSSEQAATALTRSAASLLDTAGELEVAARLWRQGRLD